MKLKDVALRLGVSVQTIRNWLDYFEIEHERNYKNQRVIDTVAYETLLFISEEIKKGSTIEEVYKEYFYIDPNYREGAFLPECTSEIRQEASTSNACCNEGFEQVVEVQIEPKSTVNLASNLCSNLAKEAPQIAKIACSNEDYSPAVVTFFSIVAIILIAIFGGKILWEWWQEKQTKKKEENKYTGIYGQSITQ